eukprot:7227587-Pyramimonas_sp.AAC.1
MRSFHSVLVDGLRHAVDPFNTDEQDELSEASESDLLGLPATDPKKWHQQERRRAVKALRWVENGTTYRSLFLFLLAAEPVMRLHYTLFKHAMEPPVGSTRKSLIFNFCCFSKSVPVEVVAKLTAL